MKALAGSASFTWVYDFGDYWAHKVKLERIVDLGEPLKTAICITGANPVHRNTMAAHLAMKNSLKPFVTRNTLNIRSCSNTVGVHSTPKSLIRCKPRND